MDSAFSAAKAALVAAVSLVHPNSNAEIFLACEASATHGAWRSLSFFSRKLSPPELKYSAFDRELLAVYSLVKHFRFFLEGRKFSIFSDHKRLATALYRTFLPLSARVQCQLAFIAELTADLHYLPGLSNIVADALSCPLLPLAVVAALTACNWVPPLPGIGFVEMGRLQQICPEVAALRTSSSLVVTTVPAADIRLFGDVSIGVFSPLVPVPCVVRFLMLFILWTIPGCRRPAASFLCVSSGGAWLSKSVSGCVSVSTVNMEKLSAT